MGGVMDGKFGEGLSERQKKWFATVLANLQKETGKSLDEWVAIARTCPHQTPKARADWLRDTWGLGVNRSAQVLSVAFPDGPGWDDPDALRAGLWKDAASLKILEALEAAAGELAQPLVVGHRKSFTAFSRDVQFAATRPLKGGRALLGLKLDPAVSPRLQPPGRRESWSERLSAVVELDAPDQVDAELKALLQAAWERG